MRYSGIIFLLVFVFTCSCGKDKPPGGGVTIPSDSTETYVTKPSINGIRIGWDYSSLTKIAPVSGRLANYSGYARIIELHDKSLLAVYEIDGNVECIKSTNGGKTWTIPNLISAASNGIAKSAPEIIELQDKSVLVSFNPRPSTGNTDPNKKYAVKTIKSYDGGVTWKDERLLYEADYRFQNGCWEPSQVQLPSGEIQLFFSNEGIYLNTDEQNISLFRSNDNGLTWTPTPQIVSYRAGRRDGMPVPIYLSNKNEIVFSIEDNNINNFKPYIIRNSTTDDWSKGIVDGNSINRNYALSNALADDIYAGAPYLRQLKTNQTILSYQSTEGRTSNILNNSRMIISIGDEDARTFNRSSEPFTIPDGRSGLWNSLCVLSDSSVIAVTSTNGFTSGKTEVWMIKGQIIPEIKAKAATVVVDGSLNETIWSEAFPVFTGHRSSAQMRMAFTYDTQNLYVAAKVSDDELFTSATNPESNDAVFFSLDAKNKSAEKLTRAIYNLTISADGKLLVKEGSKGVWVNYTGNVTTIQKATNLSTGGYNIEMSIPWNIIGGKPATGNRIGFNAGLINYGSSASKLSRECITTNLEQQPFTWCSLFLQ